MNGWDLFTWLNAAVLGGAAVVIFGFFLRDAKGILIGQRCEDDSEQTRTQPDADLGLLVEVSGPTVGGMDES